MLNNKPIRVLVDLDGVMSDFSTQYHKINGHYPVDIYGSHDLMSEEEKTVKELLFDRYIEQQGFLHAPLMPDAPELIGGLDRLLCDNMIHSIEFCTSAGGAKHETAVRGQKQEWLRKNKLNHLTAHIVTNGKKKITVIDPTKYVDILIDDTKFVADYFAAHGGISVLHTSAQDSIRQLVEVLQTR